MNKKVIERIEKAIKMFIGDGHYEGCPNQKEDDSCPVCILSQTIDILKQPKYETCEYAKSDMTPCYLRDGKIALSGDVCVGCSHSVQYLERNKEVEQLADKLESTVRNMILSEKPPANPNQHDENCAAKYNNLRLEAGIECTCKPDEKPPELYSCPYLPCKGEGKLQQNAGIYYVHCKNCGRHTDSFETSADAIKVWNDTNKAEKPPASEFTKDCRSVIDMPTDESVNSAAYINNLETILRMACDRLETTKAEEKMDMETMGKLLEENNQQFKRIKELEESIKDLNSCLKEQAEALRKAEADAKIKQSVAETIQKELTKINEELKAQVDEGMQMKVKE